MLPPQRPRQAAPKTAASTAQDAGYIDLLGVTDAFEGALQAASHRVDDASGGSALAKALAEKADLERQLQVTTLFMCLCCLNHGHCSAHAVL